MNIIVKIISEPYRIWVRLRSGIEWILGQFKPFRFFIGTKNDEYPITFLIWFHQKFAGKNASAYWPMHTASQVSYPRNVLIGKGVVPGYSPGCYIHAVNKIYIGDYTFIGPNVGIMSGNHNLNDLRKQTLNKPIIIGKYCWLGMNSMILPDVELGDFTIVGAGAIVTKSFQDGYCIIGGNPAVLIRKLEPEKCLRFEVDYNYIGYIPRHDFTDFRKNNLNV